jgi:intein/homing endonuclease
MKKKINDFIHSGFKFSKIKKITKINKSTRVFDLTVRKNSNLFVNKKLVHNCPMPLNADVWDGLYCSFGCKYCLPPTSKILMYDGRKKSIGRIKKGERVISYNTDKYEIEVSTVTDTMRRNAPDVIVIKSRGETIKLTPEHPVFTKRGWVEAEKLTTEDEVLIW